MKAEKAYEEVGGECCKRPSYERNAKIYGLEPTTFARRIKGKTKERKEAHINDQRLTPEEENVLVNWILQTAAWGFPPRPSRVRYMARDMLYKKEDHKALGIHWVDKFLSQHPCLIKKFSHSLDKERALTHHLLEHINT